MSDAQTQALLREIPALAPLDAHNGRLLENVHPPDWVNPEPKGRYNLVVVGAGTAGLVAAAGATRLGARVALVERHLMAGGQPHRGLRAVQGPHPLGSGCGRRP